MYEDEGISRNEGEFSEASTVYYGVKDGIILTMTGGMNNVGMNIIVTRYSDGTSSTSKEMR